MSEEMNEHSLPFVVEFLLYQEVTNKAEFFIIFRLFYFLKHRVVSWWLSDNPPTLTGNLPVGFSRRLCEQRQIRPAEGDKVTKLGRFPVVLPGLWAALVRSEPQTKDAAGDGCC